MPSSPNFAIPYPCENAAITVSDFSNLATATEAALVTVNAEAAAVVGQPVFRGLFTATPAFGVDTIMVFNGFPTTVRSSGVTINAPAGTVTIITPGIYVAGASVQANQSTLTMTSQRIGIYVNGVLWAVRKTRGTNPVTVGALTTAYTADLGPLAAGDVITWRYLWTGTGALSGNASGYGMLSFLST